MLRSACTIGAPTESSEAVVIDAVIDVVIDVVTGAEVARVPLTGADMPDCG